ncbi:hypothetical protein [Comamonas aquatica]|uniref:hypothetical protein n=1 Tax=Comamonas aquatica TaxID=225991 RepID=UPI00244994ED|nr:hypothetical protein [Comamonas aquatica]MDH1446782.1 hypothetical protein [Comamonas aquatica]
MTAAPAKLRSPQPQRERCSFKNKSSSRWIEKVFTKLLRQITGKYSAQSYTLCSKPSRRIADDKNVTF